MREATKTKNKEALHTSIEKFEEAKLQEQEKDLTRAKQVLGSLNCKQSKIPNNFINVTTLILTIIRHLSSI